MILSDDMTALMTDCDGDNVEPRGDSDSAEASSDDDCCNETHTTDVCFHWTVQDEVGYGKIFYTH
jgi:hypothetical protein